MNILDIKLSYIVKHAHYRDIGRTVDGTRFPFGIKTYEHGISRPQATVLHEGVPRVHNKTTRNIELFDAE
jgi:hypothetical protein